MTNELLARIGLLEKENQELKQVNEEHRILNGQLREEIKTKDKAYKTIVEELTEYAEENEKLKSQLSGTTFCYDEKEHRDLKDKIKELERVIELCHLDAKETLSEINYEQELQQKEFINYLQKEINHYTAHIEALYLAGKELINSIDKDYLEIIIKIDEPKAYFKLPELTEMTVKKIVIPIKRDLLENYMYWINYYKSKYQLGGKK